MTAYVPSSDPEPLRSEIFSLPSLAAHARQVAATHDLAPPSLRPAPLLTEFERVRDDLFAAYHDTDSAVRGGRQPSPADEWLLDNFHIVQDQMREIAVDLPRGYLVQLPRLANPQWRQYPRVYAIALDFVGHTDARLDRENLLHYILGYQGVAPLTIGELWAVPIMLRLGLVENLRRLAREEATARAERARADAWADRLFEQTRRRSSYSVVALAALATSDEPLSDGFVVQLLKRLRDEDLPMGPVFAWLDERLGEAGTTADEVIRRERGSQSTHQVSVGNCITSMRTASALDWPAFFETTSQVEQTLRRDPAGAYAAMDAPSRDRYRHRIEMLAARSRTSEQGVAEQAVALATIESDGSPAAARRRHVGYFLVDAGRTELERAVGHRPVSGDRLRRWVLSHPLAVYLGAILFVTGALLAMFAGLLMRGAAPLPAVVLALLLLLLPISELAVSLVNLEAMAFLPPRLLPKLSLDDGIPDAWRTVVAVPALLTSREGVLHLVSELEIRYVANQDPNLYFALLSDFGDAPHATLPEDAELIGLARAGIAHLNRRYAQDGSDRFYLFHRRRLLNPGEGKWMGWERKRGKLEEFNRLLRGATDTSFTDVPADIGVLKDVRYVITLDADSKLPRDAARRLVGTIAHPLNRAVFDPRSNRVVQGYGLIQPRITTTLTSAGRSLFSRLLTGNTGLDPYTTAVSDLYQDLFGETSYYGKGIYDVDAFLAAMAGRVPPNQLLSHDLFEGLFVRAALASDIELLDDFPSHYATYTGRQHRWIRGDWQLFPWLLSVVPDAAGGRRNDVPALGRWKLFDNLRRSLLAPGLLALFIAGWTILPGGPLLWTAVGIASTSFQTFAHIASTLRQPDRGAWTGDLSSFWDNLRINLLQMLLTLVLLADQARVATVAVTRTLWRLLISRRRLLEWESAAEGERRVAPNPVAYLRRMWPAPVGALLVLSLVAVLRPGELALALPLLVAWLLSPAVAARISRPSPPRARLLSAEDVRWLRRAARKTWRFFETFVTAGDHWLPPDNYQEDPKAAVAHRTSPTNIGLYLISTMAARDLGYLTVTELATRLDDTLTTIEGMERYGGHLYNWYDTESVQPLQPLYVSTVDSGNLAGFLLALAEGCREAIRGSLLTPALPAALKDVVDLLREAMTRSGIRGSASVDGPATTGSPLAEYAAVLREIEAMAETLATDETSWGLPARRALLTQLMTKAGALAALVRPPVNVPATRSTAGLSDDVSFWATSIVGMLAAACDELDTLAPWAQLLTRGPVGASHVEAIAGLGETTRLAELPARCRAALEALQTLGPPADPRREQLGAAIAASTDACEALTVRLADLAERAEACASGIDFRHVYNPAMKLFAVGFNVSSGQLDGSSYDLLASEARLASLVAIALDQVPQEHWFRLGRSLTPAPQGRALLSWSGTMFEYLMPLLVTRTYPQTLLDETYQAVIARQMQYAARRGVPWGISESAFNTLDLSLNYQYRAFGVPGLGLKTDLAEDLVVAPYATALALMVDAGSAIHNLRRLADEGMDGRFGFYEAVDYTPARVPPGRRAVIIRSFMAHHQGMSLVALDNMLNGAPMVRRFHAGPRIRATELLLQERVPGRVPLAELPQGEDTRQLPAAAADLGAMERPVAHDGPIPSAALLSNGTYSVVITAAGSGFSRYGDLAITRWREDPTLETGGLYVYMRDVDSGRVWSATCQPVCAQPDEYQVTYSPEGGRYRRRDGDLETVTEIVVSPESHAEVRRVTLTNLGERPAVVELTSYAEIALNDRQADLAHPAFGNLFVETEFHAATGALLLTRRPRSADASHVWLVHVSAVERESPPVTEYETSRPHFLGRGRDPSRPAALDPGVRLSNTTGAVLDPALALRRRVTIAPHERAVVSFTVAAAESREAALELAGRFREPRTVARTFELAWTDARAQLRHLNLRAEQAHRFQELASSLLFNDPARRAPAADLARNTRGQPHLWPYGISGDRPILLVRVDDDSATELVQEFLLAHELWRLQGLSVDLVLLTENASGYLQLVSDQLLALVRSSPAQGHLDQPGGVFVRRADALPEEDRVLLLAAARVVITTSRGRLARQLARPPRPIMPPPFIPTRTRADESPEPLEPVPLRFSNGRGGFSLDGREYIIDLPTGETTPAPWVNVVANPGFGLVVSESGSCVTWAGNSQTNRITPWSNDPVADPAGEALYVRDEEDGRVWSPTPLPSPSGGPYRVRHGQGYSRFEHVAHGIASDLDILVTPHEPVSLRRLRLTNRSGRPRRLTVTAYAEWVLGSTRDQHAWHVVTEYDAESGALFARNRYADAAAGVAFLAASEEPLGFTADRNEFLGRNGNRARPAALERQRLSGAAGPGRDPCGALQVAVEIPPGGTRELVFLLGEGRDPEHARGLIRRYRSREATGGVLSAAIAGWDDLLEGVQVETPAPELDLLINRWLLYQSIGCRFWGRSAFYQSSGAYGFRDQLQDALAYLFAAPRMTRDHILRAAARQFVEGDVQHWWHPDTGQGVRSRYSDDLLWLPYATATYVTATGDTTILDEPIPFLELRQLEPDEHELFATPGVTAETSSLYEHCQRAIQRGTTHGSHDLPLMGTGDWNDGMNRVGPEGRGESVWLAWFLAATLRDFATVCEGRGDHEQAAVFRSEALQLGTAVDAHAWDGAWYRRAYYDDGTPLGSATGDECRIDAVAQSWAVIASVGDPARARMAMTSVEHHLVRKQDRLILLLTPPFDHGDHDPGYIKGYVPGVRENGGQYTHSALWTVLATALLGDGARAMELLDLINPVHLARTPECVERYRAEPYVVAADVYAARQHPGRGGWTWYTGSASWMYRVAVESILGVRLHQGRLRVDPVIPPAWERYAVRIRHGGSTYTVSVENPEGVSRGVHHVEESGVLIPSGEIPLVDDGAEHHVRVIMGAQPD